MKHFTKLLSLVIVIVVVSAFSIFIVEDGYKVGDTARDFNLENIDGEKVSTKDYKDAKGFIVIFTCNHCPYAKLYEDRIIALHNQYAPQGYPVIAINPNDPDKQPEDNLENMKIRAAEKGFPFPYLVDETQEIARAYGAKVTPHVFLLNKTENDKLKVAYIGAIDNNHKDAEKADKKYVEDAVDALLSDEQPTESSTKGIGCTIKWRDA